MSVRVAIAVVLTVVLAFAVQLWLARYVVHRNLASLRDQSAASVMELARLAFVGGAFEAGALEQGLGAHDDRVLAVYRRDGEQLTRSRYESWTPPVLPLEARSRALKQRPFVWLVPPTPGGPLAILSAVRRDNATYFLAIFDAFSPPRLRAARLHSVGAAFVSFVVIGLGASIWIAATIRRRVRAMQSVVRQMATGVLEARLQESADDEMGALAADLNRMGAALAETIGKLREEQEAKRRMFADFTHELRTPLTNVMAYIESLRDTDVADEEEVRRRYLLVLSQQTDALARLVEDLEVLSRIECEGPGYHLGCVDLCEIAAREVEAVAPKAAEQSIAVRFESDTAVAYTIGDADRLAQVARNLLENALRYSPAGGSIQVRVSMEPAPASGLLDLRLEVADTGRGISEAHLKHLTERFYRTDPSRARHTGGRGLGLAIVRAIVEAHNGTISILSKEGDGTTVRINLRRARRSGNGGHPGFADESLWAAGEKTP